MFVVNSINAVTDVGIYVPRDRYTILYCRVHNYCNLKGFLAEVAAHFATAIQVIQRCGGSSEGVLQTFPNYTEASLALQNVRKVEAL